MKRPIPQVQTLAQESQALYDVLNKESDLACVLISASYLDYALASLLKHYFIESEIANKLLNPPRGALSAFASRTDLSYCLGLIPKGLYQNLETIGEIRNAFAHSYLFLKLDHPEIAKLIDKLTFPAVHTSITIDGSNVKHNDPTSFARFTSPRDKFTVIIVMMVNRLLLAALATEHKDKHLKGWS
ncbi:MAG: hypothetical protein ACR2GW_12640 [Pyrinomonadaceae bacterium]